MVPTRKPTITRPHPAHESFAPLVPARKPKTHGITYTPAIELSNKIFNSAKEKGVNTSDIVVALVSSGHSENQAIEILTKIYLLQNYPQAKAIAMAEQRIKSGWADAKKTILRIAIAKTRRKS